MAKMNHDLYIIANLDEKGVVMSYPTGGGSSSKPFIRAFEKLDSAKRSLVGMKARKAAGEEATVLRITKVEEAFE